MCTLTGVYTLQLTLHLQILSLLISIVFHKQSMTNRGWVSDVHLVHLVHLVQLNRLMKIYRFYVQLIKQQFPVLILSRHSLTASFLDVRLCAVSEDKIPFSVTKWSPSKPTSICHEIIIIEWLSDSLFKDFLVGNSRYLLEFLRNGIKYFLIFHFINFFAVSITSLMTQNIFTLLLKVCQKCKL